MKRRLRHNSIANIIWLFILAHSVSASAANPLAEQPTASTSSSTLRPYLAPDQQETGPVAMAGETILRITLKGHVLSEGSLAYDTPAGLLLPLGELARLLDFPISVNPSTATAQGWFIREDRHFEFAANDGLAKVDEQIHHFAPEQIKVNGLEIYVAAELLSQWLPLQFELQRNDASLRISAQEPLPLLAVLQREQRLHSRYTPASGLNELPLVKPDYRFATLPYGDVVLNSQNYDKELEDQHSGSLLLAGDLFYMGARAYVGIRNKRGVHDARMTLERKDANGRAFNNGWDVTEFSLGDLYTMRAPLIADSVQALGMQISNQPLNRLSDQETVTLQGDAPPNWDVELYRDNQLMDFTRVGDDGLYEFVDIPLRAGANPFKVVLLGPQGQRREIPESYYVGPGLTPTGKSYYRLFAGQHETRLIPEDEDFIDSDEGKSRVLAEFEYGLRPGLSVATSYAHLPVSGEQRDQATLGLRGQYRGVFARLDSAKDADDGNAWELALLTRLGRTDISMSHARFNDFVSEQTLREGAGLQSLSNLRLGLPVTWAGRTYLYNSFTAKYAEFEDQTERMELSHRASFRLWRVAVSHNLDYRRYEGGLFSSSTTSGSLKLSGRVGQRHYLQLNSHYQLRPQRERQGISISSNTRLNDRWDLRLDASRSYSDPDESRFMAGISHRGRRAIWGLGAGYSDRYGALVNANLSFSFGRNPANGGWMLDSRSLARSGLIHARSYLDKNNNGKHDPNEPGVAEAEFLSRGDDQQTDANGHITFNGYGSYQASPLRMDEKSLQDPFWIAASEGYNVVTRPGRVTQVDFSVLPTGEVDGTVYLIDGDSSQAIANVLLVLTSDNGQQYNTRSTYDGFFLFEQIPAGRYLLSIDHAQLDGKGLRASAPVAVSITEAGDVAANMDMTITRHTSGVLADNSERDTS